MILMILLFLMNKEKLIAFIDNNLIIQYKTNKGLNAVKLRKKCYNTFKGIK